MLSLILSLLEGLRVSEDFVVAYIDSLTYHLYAYYLRLSVYLYG